MSISTNQYIRKPLYVDAVRLTERNFDEVAAWCQGEILQDEGSKRYIKVRVHNPKNPRQTKALVGDWLLYTERGYKVYTNKAFHASFDRVQEHVDTGAGITQVTVEPKGSGHIPPEVSEKQMETYRQALGVYRDAETGEFVSKEYAAGHPDTTVHEHSTSQFPKFYIDTESGELTETSPHPHAQPLGLQELTNIIRNELVGGEMHLSPQTEQLFATPEKIAEAVLQSPQARQLLGIEKSKTHDVSPPETNMFVGEARIRETTVEDVPEQETVEPSAVEGKRVLSIKEQQELTSDEIRGLIQSGEAVLAQDIG